MTQGHAEILNFNLINSFKIATQKHTQNGILRHGRGVVKPRSGRGPINVDFMGQIV